MVSALHADVAGARPADFPALALRVFDYQRTRNPLYRAYLELVGRVDAAPRHWRDIPCAPIGLFRGHDVRSGDWTPEATFASSGTTGATTSRHPVRDLARYARNCRRGFRQLVGELSDYCLLALLPGYIERGDSGLVAMVDDFVARARPGSGFFLDDFAGLRARCAAAAASGTPVLLWGVSFALLDLIEEGGLLCLPARSIVVETGGMKGRREELTREQLHRRLRAGLRVATASGEFAPAPIWSEYGMTELQSQAYRAPGAPFRPAATLRVAIRDLTDPFALLPEGRGGAINVYDLANVDTLAFLQTDDLGRARADGGFDVVGRIDYAIVRGCSQLAA